jgi:phage tail sheath protein FI
MSKTLSSPGVLIQAAVDAPPIVGLAASVTAFIGVTAQGQAGVAVEISGLDAFQAAYGATDPAYPLTQAVADFFAVGGETAVIVRLDGGATTPASFDAALNALDAAHFNILVLSPDQIEGDTPLFAREAAANYVVRRTAMLILDPLAAWATAQDAAQNLGDLGNFPIEASGRIACYFPRAVAQVGREFVSRPISGGAAGLWAKTDREKGLWIAPAGVGAALPYAGAQLELTEEDLSLLFPRSINGVRLLMGGGLCLWGAVTLAPRSALSHLNVQRLLDHIEVSVQNGLAWTAVESPSPALFAQVSTEIAAFLTPIWQAGGLIGSRAADAFAVICDSSNNPPMSVVEGVLRIDLKLAVTAPAEFIILSLQVPVATQ